MTLEFKFGMFQQVVISEIGLVGRVIALLHDSEGNQYKVVYYKEGDRKDAWFFEFELVAYIPSKPVGFGKEGK